MLPSSQSGVGRCTWKSIARRGIGPRYLSSRSRGRAGLDAPPDLGEAVGAGRDAPPALDPPGRPGRGPRRRIGGAELDELTGAVRLDDDVVGRGPEPEGLATRRHPVQ